MRSALLLLSFLAAPVLADDKPAVKEIPTKGLKLTFPEKPTGTKTPDVITSEADLAKSPLFKDASDGITKHLDFAKEKLVVFTWSGSGQDKIDAEAKTTDETTTVTFKYAPGRTRDLRQHIHLFAVPKDAEVKSVTAK
jgi:hypothetical protein